MSFGKTLRRVSGPPCHATMRSSYRPLAGSAASSECLHRRVPGEHADRFARPKSVRWVGCRPGGPASPLDALLKRGVHLLEPGLCLLEGAFGKADKDAGEAL
jgi:hypothetical protein